MVKGVKDLNPKETKIFEKIRSKIIEILNKYNFKQIDLACLEDMKVLTAKSGEGIKGEIFKIENADYGLRFDLTVGSARFSSTNSFPKPFKMFSVGKVWRREEPQKGRKREFYQFEVNIIGSPSMRADAEILSISNEILNNLNIKSSAFLNNRKILNGFAKKFEIKNREEFFRILDKKDKIGLDGVREELKKLKLKNIDDVLDNLNISLEESKKFSEEGYLELERIYDILDFDIKFDLSLVRGLGYYTGPVFEFKHKKLTLIGGGRFDNLLQLYGQKDYATGMGVGITRIMDLFAFDIEERKSVYILSLPDTYKISLGLAKEIREFAPCEVDLNERKIRKQLEYASSNNIKYLIFLGKKEVDSGMLTIKDLDSGNQKTLKKEEVFKIIRDNKSI